jgi:hypothetical protein
MSALIDLDAIPAGSRYESRNLTTAQWGTVFGAWGDAIVSLGTFRDRIGRGGIIYVGMDAGVADWLGLQDSVQEVRSVLFETRAEYLAEYERFCVTPTGIPDHALISVCRRARVRPAHTYRTHIDHEQIIRRRVHHWHGARLPRSAWDWATTIAAEIGGPFVLCHPYSFQSCTASDHWDGWQGALDFLARYTPYRVALTGLGRIADGSTPSVVDLIGRAPSMAAVFALAHLAAGVVTTANGLSHYCAVAGIPALVMANRQVSERENIFRAFLSAGGIDLLDVDATDGDFVQGAARLLGLR